MITKRFNFTEKVIASLPKPSNGKQEIYYDEGQVGLCLLNSYGGTKTYFSYLKFQGRPQRTKIGRVGEIKLIEARAKARELRTLADKGTNPGKERKKVQQIAKAIASMPARDLLPTHRLNVVDDKGSSLDEASVMEAIISKLANDTLRGKVTAIKLFLELTGTLPKMQSVNMISCQTTKDSAQIVYGHTKQELVQD